jgi:hypothetical protein
MKDIEKQLDKLAEKLPKGYEVQICVEKDAGWLQVKKPTGEIVDIDGDSETCWAMLMDDALRFCIDDHSGVVKPAKVKDIIEALQKLPSDFPCYFRPKYHGDVNWCDDVPVKLNGICEMHPDGKPKNVTFLC